MRRQLRLVPVFVAAALVGTTSGVEAMVQDVYNSSNDSYQQTNHWCVVASAQTWLKYIPASTVPTQSALDAFMSSHDRAHYANGGHDPYAWAWAMYNYTPGGYGFNWYSQSDTYMDWEIVLGIRATNLPVGAIVENGKHAILVLGYSDLNDPWADKTQQINGFYIFDPWFGYKGGGVNSGMAYWGTGFQPNSYIAYSTWNSLYFTGTGSSWDGYHVAVLRSATDAAPVMSHRPQTYGDYKYNQLGLPASQAQLAAAPDSSSVSLTSAVRRGLDENGLGTGGALGVDLTGYRIGRSVHVDSLAAEVPSYDLVEIDVANQLKAVAMVTESGGSYEFAAVTPWTGTWNLPLSGTIDGALAKAGMRGPGHLVWAWTQDGGSPFLPMVAGTDAQASTPAFLTPQGRQNAISLIPGETPARH